MKKDIEWLKEKVQYRIDKLPESYGGLYFEGLRDAYRFALQDLDQLDEPEVLSPEWIESNTWNNEHIWRPFVYVDDLQNILVPKREKVKIPEFVAEVIEEHKGFGYDVYDSINLIIKSSGEGVPSISDWVAKNINKYARAWLDGYTVEVEQKYVVKLPMSKNNDNQYAIVDYLGNIWTDALPSKYKITEEEIRGLTKGDILFEHFAVKVEEFEE